MKNVNRTHSWFELLCISALIMGATARAITPQVTALISLAHAAFLLIVFLFTRMALHRFHPSVGRVFFAFTCLMLVTEIILQSITGLHLNKFVLSLLLLPQAGDHIGLSLPLILAAAALVFILAFIGSNQFKKYTYMVRGRILVLLFIVSAMTVQILYSLLFFAGKPEAIEVRRNLPLFVAPHPYYIRTLLTPVLGSNGDNPFALSRRSKPTTMHQEAEKSFKHKKNVLLIVADSLRAHDIRKDPTLTPNMTNWAKQGFVSYTHYSVSNCTHFSMFSLLTGNLPTDFEEAREKVYAYSLFETFAANGYQTTTSEASSLDWYDLANILIPAPSQRQVQTSGNAFTNDQNVTRNTLDVMTAANDKKQPFFHLAYYYGSHFPYAGEEAQNTLLDKASPYENYLKTLKIFDTEMGILLSRMHDKGLLENTIIILTSDHGEEFAADGYIGHASRLSEPQIQVPLIILGTSSRAEKMPESHLDIQPFLIEELMGTPQEFTPKKPIILANCSYAFPDGFSVLLENGPVDFSYDDAYLTPIHNKANQATKQQQRQALKYLLSAINRKGPQ